MLGHNNKKIGDCEICPKTDIEITVHYGNMWFCDECWTKEEALAAKNRSPEEQQKRVDAYKDSVESRVIETSRAIDSTIQVRTDLFNAATIAIVDIKKAIDENPEIPNKPFALAEELTSRFKHFSEVIFKAQESIIEAGNNQKAIQVYLNQLANSLRAEEREKLKISDINYKPQAVKSPVKKVSTSGTKKSGKLDKAELRKYAAELGIAEFTIQMLCVAQGITPEQAANKLRKSINEAKSETPVAKE